MRKIDLMCEKFGRLRVVGDHPNQRGNAQWLCHCDCGTEIVVRACNLKSGHTQSCGCLHSEHSREQSLKNRTHGHGGRDKKRSITYNSWYNMKARCSNPKATGYENYGGRGITVCKRWLEFENFLADMGERPDGLTLDRKNNEGNYEPSNCRWATRIEQNNNTRRQLCESTF